ncbi:MAG: hypothetical protein H0W72_03490 [Planctomycetes bacterium]|nr:hypothetical protein [Planctomycetota bacterium]
MDDLFTDIYQRRRPFVASTEAARANSLATNLVGDLQHATARLDRLVLLNAALWELLKDKLALSDAELKAMVLEIDARDGKIDNRLGPALKMCVSCGKNLMSKQSYCQYCGTRNDPADPFTAI